MSKPFDINKIDELQREYLRRFGEYWPGIGFPVDEHQERIEQCLRLNMDQRRLDKAAGVHSQAIS